MEIKGKNEVSFIRETFLGCLRRSGILEVPHSKVGNPQAFQQNRECKSIEDRLLFISSNLLLGNVEIGGNWILVLQ
jgi:hypothetical protein